eukprot:PhM_4_TR6784/c1_g1_i3/m.50334
MNAQTLFVLLAVVVLGTCTAPAAAQLSVCSAANETAIFAISNTSVTPAVPTRGTWTFDITGNAVKALSGMTAIVASQLCLTTDKCITVDTRTVNCVNPSCDFAAGSADVKFSQTVPSIAPAGSYVVLMTLNANVGGAPTNVGCVKYAFKLQ